MRTNPGLITQFDETLAALSVRIQQKWVVLGTHDFVYVVEAADVPTIALASAEIVSHGDVRITTLQPCRPKNSSSISSGI